MAQSVSYPNGNPGDWSDLVTTLPAPITPVATGGPGGGAYTQIYNVPDEYSTAFGDPPGYGSGPYSLFGAGITTTKPFEQSIDVYINADWAAPTPSYAQSFWIDMQPNTSDGSSGAEHNFRVTADGSAVSVLVDGQASPISTITTSGWYDFQMTYSPGATGTDPEVTDMNIFNVNGAGNPDALIGTTTVIGDSPGGPTDGDVVTGSGYVWFTVWANGSAGDSLNVADVTAEANSVPDEASTLPLLAVGFAALAGLRRRLNRA